MQAEFKQRPLAEMIAEAEAIYAQKARNATEPRHQASAELSGKLVRIMAEWNLKWLPLLPPEEYLAAAGNVLSANIAELIITLRANGYDVDADWVARCSGKAICETASSEFVALGAFATRKMDS